MSDKAVRYTRGEQFAVLARDGKELRESWDNHPYRVLFRSHTTEDLMLRMEHRDEVLRKQGFVPDRDWRELFPPPAEVVVEIIEE